MRLLSAHGSSDEIKESDKEFTSTDSNTIDETQEQERSLDEIIDAYARKS